MKKNFAIVCIWVVVTSSFAQTKSKTPEVNPIAIQSSFKEWLNYQTTHIMLSRNFIALDFNSKEISKEAFLNELISGNYIPIQLQSEDASINYQLFKIEPQSDTSIKATISQSAFEEYEHFKMEGTLFPDFSFQDLQGNWITNESLKGKIVVIKCWYIHCAACIKEFPEVNALVEKYSMRKDIVFVSLAEDTPEQLTIFLQKKPLLYAVVPNLKKYMNETLHLNSFPTHFIVNKNGYIEKVLPDFESLKVALEMEIK